MSETIRSRHTGDADTYATRTTLQEKDLEEALISTPVLLLVSVGALLFLCLALQPETPRVKAYCGQIQGILDTSNNVYYFKGIPYAAPPVGPRRWQPPKAMSWRDGTCWNGVYKAVSAGKQCAQQDPFTGRFVGSEDCLVLDVFTPSMSLEERLPVLVYFHGGYLRFGNISTPGFLPHADLAIKFNMVIVNVQYRLGALGFLVLDELKNRTGNYGFLDQIQALRWVQQNILSFGGDPKQVTISGQSSGGSSVLFLMMTPLAKGLFHRAWSSSGSPVLSSTYQDAIMANAFFTAKVGCDKALDKESCLLSLPASTAAMSVYPEWTFDFAMDLPEKGLIEVPLAIIDGTVFSHGLLEAYEKGVATIINDVPVVIGTTAQEADVLPEVKPPTSPEISKWSEATYTKYVSEHLDTFSPEISQWALRLYPYSPDPELVYTSMVSDVRVNCPNDVIAGAISRLLTSPVYRYIITAHPSSPVKPCVPFRARYAFHVWDLLAFLDTFESFMEGIPTRHDRDYVKNLQDNIVAFIKSGKPLDKNWKPYPATVGLLSHKTTAVPSYQAEQCQFWMKNGFFEYGWRN